MEPAAGARGLAAGVGAVRTAAAQVAQRCRLAGGREQHGGPGEAVAAGGAPVRPGRPGHDSDAPQRGHPDREQQRGVGEDTVRRTGRGSAGTAGTDDQQREQGDRNGRGDRDRAATADRPRPADRPAGARPGRGRQVGVVPLAADRRQDGRRVDRELVRRRVHAGRVAGAAVVAQVGQVRDVALGQCPAPLERGKDRAVSFAVPAGVADGELTFRLGEQPRQGIPRRVVRARHGVAHEARPAARAASAAASVPAIRPQTVPIVSPKPPR